MVGNAVPRIGWYTIFEESRVLHSTGFPECRNCVHLFHRYAFLFSTAAQSRPVWRLADFYGGIRSFCSEVLIVWCVRKVGVAMSVGVWGRLLVQKREANRNPRQ